MNLKSLLGFLNANKLFIVIVVVSTVLCGFNIFGYPIYILDEVRNAEAAREMLFNANYIVPTFNNVLRTDKPPLHYFFMMLGYKLFGVNAFGARFFSSVFGMLTLVTTFYYVKKIKGREVAVTTWCILIAAVFFVQEFHLSVPDPYLIFFINLSLFGFYNFYRNGRLNMLLMGYVAVALGFLAKGPIALGIVGLSVLLFLILRREISLKRIFIFKPILGLLIVFIIVFPWFYSVHLETDGAWTRGFFLDHNLNRFESKMEGHGGPFFITWLFVLLGLMPFSVFIIQAFYFSFKQRNRDSFTLFALSACMVVIAVFTFSGTKLPNYTMPCYPLLAFLIAAYLIDFYKKVSPRRRLFVKISFIVLLVISFALPAGAFIALSLEKGLEPVKQVSFLLIILPVGTTIGYLFFKENDYRKSFAVVTSTWVLLSIFLFGIIYPNLLRQNPVYVSQKVLDVEVPVVVFKRMDSAFPFNYKRTYEVVGTAEELKSYLSNHPHAYVITNDRKAKEELGLLTNDMELILERKAIFENHTTLIYEKNPAKK